MISPFFPFSLSANSPIPSFPSIELAESPILIVPLFVTFPGFAIIPILYFLFAASDSPSSIFPLFVISPSSVA